MGVSEIEKMTWTVELNEQLHVKVQEKIAEGWNIAPGTVPTATYELARVKPQSGIGGTGTLSIDESKIFVIPGDKVN